VPSSYHWDARMSIINIKYCQLMKNKKLEI
jgi:hypothetical protein